MSLTHLLTSTVLFICEKVVALYFGCDATANLRYELRRSSEGRGNKVAFATLGRTRSRVCVANTSRCVVFGAPTSRLT